MKQLPPHSWPGTSIARNQGCTCPNVQRVMNMGTYGEPIAIDVDAFCPLHGLTALIEDAKSAN